jgi:phosphate transport system substrate-binding protein
MVILVQRWAERYMNDHPAVLIEVSGGGTGAGISALREGTITVAAASRELSAREVEQLPGAERTHVALDAIAVYVHRDNPLRSLDMETLARIFRGRIRDWAEVSPAPGRIVLYSRENNSGTYAFFKERVLSNLDFDVAAQTLPGTAAVIDAVAQDPRGIGYGGIGYGRGARALALRTDEGDVLPTEENASSGRYPLARFLNLVTRSDAPPATRAFVTWTLEESAQQLARDGGFFPLPKP